MFNITIFFKDDTSVDIKGDIYQIDKKYFSLFSNENSYEFDLNDIFSIHFYIENYKHCFLKYFNPN